MADFKIPDNKKAAGKFLGLGLLGAAGVAIWAYVVPFLAAMAWNTVSLIVACAVVGILGMILLSKKFWNRMGMILEALGNMLFGWFIEMNPFAILNLQLDRSEKDRQNLFTQAGKLKAQEANLDSQLKEENKVLQLAAKKVELCRERLAKNALDEDAGYNLESATVEYTNAKDFIDKVGPIKGDISRLVMFADKAYKKSGYALANAKATVKSQKAAYDAVSAGQNAMSKALRAFTGDPEMNKAGEIALNKLKSDIADKIGTIKNCIAETSKLMNERDLNDAAKVSMAAENMAKLNIDNKFDYVAEVTESGQVNIPIQSNKWLDTLKK
jgi:hypothetical protein